MEKIIVNVAWCDKNFGGTLSDNVWSFAHYWLFFIPTKPSSHHSARTYSYIHLHEQETPLRIAQDELHSL